MQAACQIARSGGAASRPVPCRQRHKGACGFLDMHLISLIPFLLPSEDKQMQLPISQTSAGCSAGFSSLKSLRDFEATHGPLPNTFPIDFDSFNRGLHAAPQVPLLDREVARALLALIRFPATHYRDIMSSSSREKPRYLFIADLLGGLVRLSSGRLMLSALGLEEEQEAAAFDEEEEEETDVADPRPWPGKSRTLHAHEAFRTRFRVGSAATATSWRQPDAGV